MSTTDRQTTCPPLVSGQRLSQNEFHRRYEAMPPETRAELIGGVVHMPSPLGRMHGKKGSIIITWIGTYESCTPGVEGLDNATTILDELGEVQPDVQLRILPEYGGQSRNDGPYVGGAPELIVEIAHSTREVDLKAKRADYERAGVQEYVVCVVDPVEVVWHERQGERLVRIAPGADGNYRSRVFPGLWLDPRALQTDDTARLLAVLHEGLATPEHAAFVDRLEARRGTSGSDPAENAG